MGLKENVIIGKLIPAGAGLTAYREFAEELVPDREKPAEEETVAERLTANPPKRPPRSPRPRRAGQLARYEDLNLSQQNRSRPCRRRFRENDVIPTGK